MSSWSGAARSAARTRVAYPAGPSFTLIAPDWGRLPWVRAIIALGEPQTPAQQLDGELAAGCCWPVRTPTGCLVPAPVLMVRAT